MKSDDKTGSEVMRELRLLEALEQEPEVKQATLAAKLGLAVGTVNWLLKRLTARGYVKVKRIGRWRWSYLLTPQGFAAKARLTSAYIQNSMQLYRETRKRAKNLLLEVKRAGYEQIQIEGDSRNDLGDVCRLTCMEQGIKLFSSETTEVSPTTHRPPSTTSHGLHTTTHNSFPVLRIDGEELSLEWRKGEKDD